MQTRQSSQIRRSLALIGCGTIVLGAAGCVPQDKYDDLLTSYRTLKEENVALQSELESVQSTTEMYQNRIGASGSQLSQLESENDRLRREISQMENDYQALVSRLDNMKFGPLPEDVNSALEALAARYPSLLTYDANLGMVRFASDLTFALGSSELTTEAKRTLSEFANIANSSSISGYELKLVGHTDTVPIKNPATRAKHPTNRHLSVHRAIAVAHALIDNNVAAARIQTAGYGPYRPVVANGPSGAAENRRVEIFIVPMQANLADLPTMQDVNRSSSGTDTANVPLNEPMK